MKRSYTFIELAMVIVIHKYSKMDRNYVANYRPVS